MSHRIKSIFTACVFAYVCPQLRAQTPVSVPAAAIHQVAGAGGERPFDRLELLAFIVNHLSSSFVSDEIRTRGLSFEPDEAFLAAVRSVEGTSRLVETVKEQRPRELGVMPKQRGDAYDILLQAVEGVRTRQFDSAGEKYAQTLKIVPDSATLHLAYARTLFSLKRYDEAESECRESLSIWPGDAEGHTWLATILMMLRRDSEAVPEAREALRIFPPDKAELITLGMSLARSRQYADAIPVLREAISKTPELPVLHKLLGISLLHTGESDEAIGELTLYLKSAPQEADAHYNLGAALRMKGEHESALAEFREAARIEPNNPLFAVVANPDGTNGPRDNGKGPRPDDCFFTENVYTNTFFGFSYTFPKNWKIMRADAGKVAARQGGKLVTNGDPIMQDMVEAGVGVAYSLLAVAEGTAKDGMPGQRSIVIQAMDRRVEPNVKSAEDLAKSINSMFPQGRSALKSVGLPQEISVGDRTFWRVNMEVHDGNEVRQGAELIGMEKGYVLLFVFASHDGSRLDDLVGTMQSLRFSETPR